MRRVLQCERCRGLFEGLGRQLNMADPVEIKAGQIWRGERGLRMLYVYIEDADYGGNVLVYSCEEDGTPRTMTNHHGTLVRRRVVRRGKFEPRAKSGFALYRDVT
jgi:hypothetical protein